MYPSVCRTLFKGEKHWNLAVDSYSAFIFMAICYKSTVLPVYIETNSCWLVTVGEAENYK